VGEEAVESDDRIIRKLRGQEGGEGDGVEGVVEEEMMEAEMR